MAFCFVPNGVNLKNWGPERSGSDYELPWSLQPLSALRDDLLVLTGLTHDKGRANGDGAGEHARSASVFLTGAQPVKTHGSGIRVGMSADQAAAGKLGDLTKFSSIELGCPALLMTSAGGLTTLETAMRFPIRLVESGPAGGAILAGVRTATCGRGMCTACSLRLNTAPTSTPADSA